MVPFPCPGILHQEEINLRVVIKPEGTQWFLCRKITDTITDTILPMSRETNKNKTQNNPESGLITSIICYFLTKESF